jgi:hypothetical protein
VEQFVGLMLDKSKGLVLGPELVTNGDFSSGTTGWTCADGTISVVGGALRVSQGAVNDYVRAYQAVSCAVGKWYQITGALVGKTASNAAIQIQTTTVGTPVGVFAQNIGGASGTYSGYFLATAATMYVWLLINTTTNDVSADFDNISVRELPGNHATQTTSAKRPKLAARYNLLTYTEQFDDAAWTRINFLAFGSGSIVNAIAAPDGTVTADLLTESTAASANFFFNQTTVLSSSTTYTYSIYCKPNGRFRLYLAGNSTAWGAGSITFNLNTGVVSPSSGSGWTGTIENLPDGWYRITATRTTNAGISGGYALTLFFLDNAGNVTYTGDGVSGMYFWGADLRPASQATGLIGPTYQRVVDAATYDAVGFLPYLQFDGLSWSMSTGSIDFTATDKMTVWAGVRKLSDATEGCLYELSSNFGANNGSFTQFARGSVYPAGFDTPYRGTSSNTVPGFSAAAPTTRVNTTLYNIAAPSAVVRSNGAQVYSDTTSVGTGNFGNYPLFIGARNNASFFFNGWLTSLIVRGAQSTQGQIEATESWVAGKTGVSL